MTMSRLGDRPPNWSVEELARFLVAPDAGEYLSPIVEIGGKRGPGAFVVDLRASTEDETARWWSTLEPALAVLPCVTIAIEADDEGPTRDALAARCDVRVVDHAAAEQVLSGFAETPISGLAFAQLLRCVSERPISESLVAESFAYSTLQAGAEFHRWLESRRKKRRSPDGDNPSAVRVDRVQDRLEIHLTRPRKHNAFSRAMRDGITEAFQLALADPTIEEIVLSGEGESFCSGGDLDEFGSFPDPAEAHAIRTTRSPALLLSRLADRVRVEVHGACIGAGAELSAFCARVVADDDAFFQLPEVGLGLVPGAGGTASLPLRIGRQRTAWLGLSGAKIDAQTALAWGLVDEVRLRQHVGPEQA